MSQLSRYLTGALFVLGVTSAVASGEEPGAIKPPPWHLVDLWWDMGHDHPFEKYSITVTIHNDLPPDVRLYVAPIGVAYLSKTQFYGGLQTQSDGGTKDNPAIRGIGPGALMSMWGQRSADAIRPSLGGFYQSSGHEGDFVSVRRPYAWTKGTYTYWVARMDKETVADKPYTWVGAFVYSHQRNENIFIGALRFPGENLVLGKTAANFVEIYGPRVPLEKIPKVQITFGDLMVNGEPIANPGASAQYNPGVPDYAEAVAQDGRVLVKVGEPVANRTSKHVKLLPAK